MAKAIPHAMLMWVQSNENHEDIVVRVETRPLDPKVGDTIWSEALDRFGTVEKITPTATFVRIKGWD